jgi:hypothetical protein
MRTEIQLPVISEDVQNLELLVADAERRLIAARKLQQEQAAATNRAARLVTLKDQFGVDTAALAVLQREQIPAGFALLQEVVAARYTATNGRSNSLEHNTKVENTTARLIRQIEDVHRRTRQLAKQRADIETLQAEVDGDVAHSVKKD